MNELPTMRAKARRCTIYQLRLCVCVLVLILLSKQCSEYIQFHQSLTSMMTPEDIHANNSFHHRQKVDNSKVRKKQDSYESGFDRISNELYESASAKYGNETNIHRSSSYGTVNDEKMEKVFLQIFNGSDFKVQNQTILEDIYTSSSSVFEYGIGESTRIASANCVARYTGVDEKAKLITTLRNRLESKYFRFQYAMRTNSVQLLYDFVMTPLILERNAFDIYFVNLDRVGVDVGFSCIVASILHALKHKAKSSRLVVYTTKFKDQENMMKLIGKVFSSHMTFNDVYGKITIQQNEAKNILKNWCFKFLMEKYGFLPKDISKYISQEENGFDTISSILYDKMSSHFFRIHKVERKPFDLISWHRQNKITTGGLKATDRKLIGSMYSTKESIFEYGLGESTYIASHVNVPRYKGTDSDTTWISNVQKHAPDHFRFFFSDIGEILEWGKPANILFKSRFNYQIAPLIVERKPFELYFIDGRYRIGCFCVSFLHAFKFGANMTTVRVAVHDNHRKQYHKAHSTVANVVMRTEELWVYALKETTTENDLYKLWKKYGSEIL